MRSKLAVAIGYLALFIGCVAAFSLLYRGVSPLRSLKLSIDADSAGRKAASIVHEIFPALAVPGERAQLSKNDALIRDVLAELGQEQGTSALREKIPGFLWIVRWRRPASGNVEVVTSEDRRPENRDALGRQSGEIRVQLSTSGDLVGYAWNLPDTASIATMSSDSLRHLAEEFLGRHFAYVGGWHFVKERRNEQAHRTDMEYTWESSRSPLDRPVVAKVVVAGREISTADLTYTASAAGSEEGDGKVHGVAMALLIVGLGILMVVVAFRRSRAYEMSFRLGGMLGVGLALLLAFEIYMNVPADTGWEMLLSLVLGPAFYGGGFLFVWSVAESVAREAWQEKFVALDLVIKWHPLHRRVGRSVLQGMVVGAVSCLVWVLLLVLARAFVPDFYVPVDSETLGELTRAEGSFVLAARSVTDNAYLFAALLLFLVSLLRFRSRSAFLLVVAGAVALGISNKAGILPVAAGMAIGTLVALVLSWGFYKLDVLASFVSFVTMSMLLIVPPLFALGTSTSLQSGSLLVAMITGLAAWGVLALLTHDTAVDLDAITPAFVKHITERERLQRELEIARDVQMSFLPRIDPVISGVDIASRCTPALEVGGDYYDFVDLGADRFGVVVGDVSGKGTHAAFYMTLTKGFLKAVTRASESPAQVLTQLNDLFYENVERGTFISMVYGIFDLRRRIVTIARAGHNPPLVRRGGTHVAEFVQPAGLALGLEAGGAFAGAIKEYSTGISAGDLYVFYTDGFTESMNRQREEYGEERLRHSVENHAAGSAREVMDGIFADILEHTGKTRQHDDMTIVVVRVV
jgi:sigma-B regulation protein RsbU (phosphoserine phosphatase)